MASSRFRVFLVLLALCAFGITLLVGLQRASADYFQTQGDREYDVLATSLVDRGEYMADPEVKERGRPPLQELAYRPPGFPAALTVAYAVGGRSPVSVVVLQSVLASLIAVTTALIGRRLLSARAGLAAGILAAAFPYSLVQNVGLIDTTLITALLLAAVFLAIEPMTWPRLVWFGLVSTGAVLTRPTAALVVVVLLAWMWFRSPQRARLALPVAIIAAGVGAWIIRDWVVLGSPVFIATNGGWNLWLGNNPHTVPYLMAGTNLDRIEFNTGQGWSHLAGLGEVERDRYFRAEAITWMLDNPGSAAWTLAVKAFYTFAPIQRPFGGAAKGLVFLATAAVLYGLAALGAVLLRRERWPLLLAAVVAAIGITEILFFPYTRLLAPAFPLMAVLAVAGLGAWVHRRRGRVEDGDGVLTAGSH